MRYLAANRLRQPVRSDPTGRFRRLKTGRAPLNRNLPGGKPGIGSSVLDAAQWSPSIQWARSSSLTGSRTMLVNRLHYPSNTAIIPLAI